jgi:thioesterase-3
VNNARYLEFLEAARWDFIAENMSLKQLEEAGISFLVVNININYRHPAQLADILSVDTRMKHISGKSAKVHQVIRLEGTDRVVVDADITFVVIDVKSEKVLPISGQIREIISHFQE